MGGELTVCSMTIGTRFADGASHWLCAAAKLGTDSGWKSLLDACRGRLRRRQDEMVRENIEVGVQDANQFGREPSVARDQRVNSRGEKSCELLHSFHQTSSYDSQNELTVYPTLEGGAHGLPVDESKSSQACMGSGQRGQHSSKT